MAKVCEIGVLFSDVAGSSRLYESLGDTDALTIVETCIQLLSATAEEYGGSIVKTIGDEVMAVFGLAETTLDAAIAMQQRIAELDVVPGIARAIDVQVRTGLNFGYALCSNSDYFGDTVNIAAHLSRLSRGGQILTTRDTVESAAQSSLYSVRDRELVPIKGRQVALPVVEVLWQRTTEITVFAPGRAGGPHPAANRLLLTHCGQQRIFDPASQVVTIGREGNNDIVILNSDVSRRHATVEFRGGRWILSDRSTNGTFVSSGSSGTVRLHWEEFILQGSGQLTFGHRTADGGAPECVQFALIPREFG